jgi:hypothetical protein
MLLIAAIPTFSVWMMGRGFGYSICPLLLPFICLHTVETLMCATSSPLVSK